MVVLSASDQISTSDLPDEILSASSTSAARGLCAVELPEDGISLEAVERELLLQALERSNWNQTQAARLLDLSRRTLIYRMEKHGLVRSGGTALADAG